MVCETYADAFTWNISYFLLEFVRGSDWGLCQTSWWGTDLQKKQNGQLVLPVTVCDFRYWGELFHIITQLCMLMFDLLKGCSNPKASIFKYTCVMLFFFGQIFNPYGLSSIFLSIASACNYFNAENIYEQVNVLKNNF